MIKSDVSSTTPVVPEQRQDLDLPVAGSHSSTVEAMAKVARHAGDQTTLMASLVEALGKATANHTDQQEAHNRELQTLEASVKELAGRLQGVENAQSRRAESQREEIGILIGTIREALELHDVRGALEDERSLRRALDRQRLADLARIRSLSADRDALEVEIQANAARHRRELSALRDNGIAQSQVTHIPQETHTPPPVTTEPMASAAQDLAGAIQPPIRNAVEGDFPEFKQKALSDRTRATQLLGSAQAAMRGKDWARASIEYRALLDYSPNKPNVWKQYGHAVKELGDLAVAERAYFRALLLNPSDTDTCLHLGHVLKNQGKVDLAADVFKAALIMQPDFRAARDGLGDLGCAVPEVAAATSNTAPSSSLQKWRFKRGLKIAKAAATARDWATAAIRYEGLSQIKPLDVALIVQRGHAFMKLGRVDEAEALYRKAVAIEPLNSDAHLQLGHALKLKGDHETARSCYLTAVRFGPDNRDALDEL